jgi:hypothetical protein
MTRESQSSSVVSVPAEADVLRSPANATARTWPVCPSKQWRSWRENMGIPLRGGMREAKVLAVLHVLAEAQVEGRTPQPGKRKVVQGHGFPWRGAGGCGRGAEMNFLKWTGHKRLRQAIRFRARFGKRTMRGVSEKGDRTAGWPLGPASVRPVPGGKEGAETGRGSALTQAARCKWRRAGCSRMLHPSAGARHRSAVGRTFLSDAVAPTDRNVRPTSHRFLDSAPGTTTAQAKRARPHPCG